MTGTELDTNVLAPLDSGFPLSDSQQTLSPLTIASFAVAAAMMGVLIWIILADGVAETGPKVVIALSSVSTSAAKGIRAEPGDETSSTDDTHTGEGAFPIGSQIHDAEEITALNPALSQPVALPPAPVRELTEESPNGLLPKIAADGRRPLDVYARPFPDGQSKTGISIVVRGLGLSQRATEAAIKTLPPEVSLAFVPYPKNLQVWVDQAREAGHEVLLEIPMEPFGYPNNDPGPYTLLTEAGESENLRRLEWLLGRFTGYVGVTNYLGDKFGTSKTSMAPVLRALENRGLLYLDDNGSGASPVRVIADSIGMVWGRSHRTFDRASASSIETDLTSLELIAQREGHAIGTGFSFPVTIRAIAEWADTLPSKGLVLMPVSATMER